jgi:hypothetical protein
MKNDVTSAEVATKASKVMRRKTKDALAKSAAASALAQRPSKSELAFGAKKKK